MSGSLVDDTRAYLKDIRLEHSLFALPFAALGLLMGAAWMVEQGLRASVWPTARELVWFLVAMVGTRSAAMGFNRLVDRRLDAGNPRTAGRPLAAGRARPGAYAAYVALGAGMLLVAAWQFNPLALELSPVVLLVALGYSLTKRFTAACHYVLGLALALSPVGAWVALTGQLPWQPAPYLLAAAVMSWVGGFDILYATMDHDFDREAGLHSIPVWLGIETSLVLARLSHLAMVLVLVGVAYTGPGLGAGFAGGVVVTAVLLHFEHRLVRPDDLRRVNLAFFTLNGVLGVLLLAAGLVDFAGWLG